METQHQYDEDTGAAGLGHRAALRGHVHSFEIRFCPDCITQPWQVYRSGHIYWFAATEDEAFTYAMAH